jgi:hypothetical protein
MIVLDENIDVNQRRQLQRWRIHFKHVGTTIGRRGMKDRDQILPLLHQLPRPTFFTYDLGLYDRGLRHPNYCLVCLDVSLTQGAEYVRRLLKHPSFKTKSRRVGKVIRVTATGITYWALREQDQISLPWCSGG